MKIETTNSVTFSYEDENKQVDIIASLIMAAKDVITIDDEEVKLPKPQRAGTVTQQVTYAKMEARKILENFKNKKHV